MARDRPSSYGEGASWCRGPGRRAALLHRDQEVSPNGRIRDQEVSPTGETESLGVSRNRFDNNELGNTLI